MYNTNNPIPSNQPKDLSDNAESFDIRATSLTVESTPDRLGVDRLTWHGMEQRFKRYLESSGYSDIGDYAPGLVVELYTQVFHRSGGLWRAKSSTPLPYTLNGDWAIDGPLFLDAGDAILRQDLALDSGASIVGADDGASGSLWTTVAGFIAFLLSSLGASVIGFIQAGVGSVARTAQSKMRDSVSVKDFGAVGDGVTDDTAAIQAALNSNRSVLFPKGVYLTDEVTVPLAANGATYSGDGFWHYDGPNGQTVFVAKTDNQNSIFKLANGADNITFQKLRLSGADKAQKGIDATFGAFLSLDTVGVYDTKKFGVYSAQGLMRVTNCSFYSNTEVGLHVYSDAWVYGSEFAGGTVPLLITAGGARITDCLANSGSECCIRLKPLTSSTNLFFVNMSGLYVGETRAGAATSAPIIEMQSNGASQPRYITINGSTFVHGEVTNDHVNGAIKLTSASEVVISNNTFFGLGFFANASRWTDYFVNAQGCTDVTISNNVVKSCNKNPIILGASCFNVNISGNTFSEYATSIAVGTEGAAILITDVTNYGVISGNSFDTASASTVPYAIEGGRASRFPLAANLIRYSNATIWGNSDGYDLGGWQRLGNSPRPVGTVRGAVASYDPPSLADGAGTTTTVTVTGAALGDAVTAASFSNDLQGVLLTAWVSAANTVSVRFQNETGAAVDLAAGAIRVYVTKMVTF